MAQERKVLQADYHRNGVGGEGFFVGIVRDEDNTDKLIVWFPEYVRNTDRLQKFQTRVAVLDVREANLGNIYMYPHGALPGGNAWRGADKYGETARELQRVWDERHEGTMRGLFEQGTS